MVQVEVFLSSVFNSDGVETDEEALAFEGAVPPHFYGEMAKTELGCQVLQDKGHFIEFTMFIKKHGLEGEDAEIIMKLKSILWAVVSVVLCSVPDGVALGLSRLRRDILTYAPG